MGRGGARGGDSTGAVPANSVAWLAAAVACGKVRRAHLRDERPPRGVIIPALGKQLRKGRGPPLLKRRAATAPDDLLAGNLHVHAGEGSVVRGELPQDDAHRVDLCATAVRLRGSHLPRARVRGGRPWGGAEGEGGGETCSAGAYRLGSSVGCGSGCFLGLDVCKLIG